MTTKIGRNDPCPCGSHKKFKMCCIHLPSTDAQKPATTRELALATTTDEPIMPVRLYYTISDSVSLVTQLGRLNCIESGDDNTYIINYAAEARKIDFSKKYKDPIFRKNAPIILAVCTLKEDKHFTIDVKSHHRAIHIIQFIHQHIPREAIEITHAATYNEMLMARDYEAGAKKVAYSQFDTLFAPEDLVEIVTQASIKNLRSDVVKEDNQQEVAHKITKKLHEEANNPLPLVEKFPVHFYTDGIRPFEMSLGFKAKVAQEHLSGNPDYTVYDAVKDFAAYALAENNQG